MLALPLALTAAAPAAAQSELDGQPWEEEATSEVEPTSAFAEVDLQSSADDRRDLWEIRDVQRQWRDGLRSDDSIDQRLADRRLMRWIEDELAEDQFEVDAEERELAEARARGAHHRVRVERMELMRARADLAATRRAYDQLQGLRLAFDAGRATDAHRVAMADLIARLVRMAEDDVHVSREEEREDREAYLDTLRVDPSDRPA